MTTKIVSVISNSKKIFNDAIQSKRLGADILELRFDLLYPEFIDPKILVNTVKTIKKNVNLPIIITIRLKSEGGKYIGNEQYRFSVFEKIIPYIDFIDIELKSKILRKIIHLSNQNNVKIIISYHNFNKTPNIGYLSRLINKTKNFNPNYIKIATLINKSEDFIKLTNILYLSNRLAIIPMTNNKSFMPLRILPYFMNSSLFYVYLSKPTAPGQFSLKDIINLL